MQLPEPSPFLSHLSPGPWLPSRSSNCFDGAHGLWGAAELRPLAAAAAGLAYLRLRDTARGAQPKQAPQPSAGGTGLTEVERRRLDEHLADVSFEELRELAQQLGLSVPKRISRTNLLLRLTEPDVIKKTKDLVMPDDLAIPAISPEELKDLEFYLETVTAKEFPRGVGQGRAPQAGAAKSADTAVATARGAEQGMLQICDVRAPLQKKKGRRLALQSPKLKVGGELSGTVVEVSLNDGLRVDVGAVVDVLVPIVIEDADVAKVVMQEYPLKKEIVVKIEDVSEDPSRRFPVIASLKEMPPRTRLKLEDAMAALQPHPSNSPRGADQVNLDTLDDWRPEGKLEVRQELEDLPRRPPPEVVKSLGSDGQLQEVQVPESVRHPAEEASDEGRAAWVDFAEEQVEELRLQMRCRNQLASDLQVIEADLLQGRLPSIPVELLGLASSEDCTTCLIPIPEGDCLKFQKVAFDEAKDLADWTGKLREGWQERAEEPMVKEKLAQFFACADAWHARTVQAAQAAEIQRLGWGRDTDDGTLAAEVSQMIADTPELQDQETLQAQYLVNLMDESGLKDLGDLEGIVP